MARFERRMARARRRRLDPLLAAFPTSVQWVQCSEPTSISPWRVPVMASLGHSCVGWSPLPPSAWSLPRSVRVQLCGTEAQGVTRDTVQPAELQGHKLPALSLKQALADAENLEADASVSLLGGSTHGGAEEEVAEVSPPQSALQPPPEVRRRRETPVREPGQPALPPAEDAVEGAQQAQSGASAMQALHALRQRVGSAAEATNKPSVSTPPTGATSVSSVAATLLGQARGIFSGSAGVKVGWGQSDASGGLLSGFAWGAGATQRRPPPRPTSTPQTPPVHRVKARGGGISAVVEDYVPDGHAGEALPPLHTPVRGTESRPRRLEESPLVKSHRISTSRGAPVSGPVLIRVPLPVVVAHVSTHLQAGLCGIPVPLWRRHAEAAWFLHVACVTLRSAARRIKRELARRMPWSSPAPLQGEPVSVRRSDSGATLAFPARVFTLAAPRLKRGHLATFRAPAAFVGLETSSETVSCEVGVAAGVLAAATREKQARRSVERADAACKCILQCLVDVQAVLQLLPPPGVTLQPLLGGISPALGLSGSHDSDAGSDALPSTPTSGRYAANPFGPPTPGQRHQASPPPPIRAPRGNPSPGTVPSSPISWVDVGSLPARRTGTLATSAPSTLSDDLAVPSTTRQSSYEGQAPSLNTAAAALPYPPLPKHGTLVLPLPRPSYAAALRPPVQYAVRLRMRPASTGVPVFAQQPGEARAEHVRRMLDCTGEALRTCRLPEADAAWAEWNMAAALLVVNLRTVLQSTAELCPWSSQGTTSHA